MHALSLTLFALFVVLATFSQSPAVAEDKSLDEIYRQGQDLTESKREELIKLTEDILRNAENRDSPDLWLRLAEYYWEKGRARFIKENEAIDQGKMKPGKKAFEESEKYKNKAVKIYQQIAKQHPDYPDRDKVLLLLGLALYEMGHQDLAINQLKEVSQTTKKVPYKIHANLSLGEHYFQEGKPEIAVPYYEFLLRYKDSKFYKLALYKLAWCYYNMKDYKQAFRYFKSIINIESNTTFQQTLEAFEIKDEAAKGIVLVFADMVEGPEAKTAKTLLYSISPKNYGLMLYRLINLFFDQGKNQEAIWVAQDYLAIDPYQNFNPLVQKIVYEAYYKLDQFNESILAKKIFQEKYNPEAPWFKHTSRKQEEREKVMELMDVVLKSLITHYQTVAMKLKKQDLIAETKHWYDLYFAYFPNSKAKFSLQLKYAEFLYELGEYMAAFDYYMALMASSFERTMKLKIANDAILSLENLKKQLTEKKQPHPPELNEKLLFGYQEYLKLKPGKKETITTTLAVAKIFHELKKEDAAEKICLQLIEEHTNTQEALFAAQLILKIHSDRKDTKKLNDYAKQFLAKRELHHDGFKKDLEIIYERTSFQLIEKLIDEQQYAQAAEAYMAFIGEFPTSQFLDKAYNNAGINFEKAGMTAKAVPCYMAIITKLPSSSNFDSSVKNVIRLHTATGNFDALADFMVYFSLKYPKREESPGYLFQAAVFYEKLGNTNKAVELYTTFAQRYPQHPKAAHLTFKIAEVWREAGKSANAKKTYQKYLDEGARTEDNTLLCWYHLGKLGTPAEKETSFRKGANYFDGVKKKGALKEGLQAAAEMKMFLLDKDYDEFLKIELKLPESNFPKQIKRKGELKEQLEEAFLQLIELGVNDVGIEALVKIAMLRVDLQDMLLNDPTLMKIDPEEREAVKAELRAQTQPLIDEAVSFLQKGVDIAFNFNIYNDWTNKAQDLLGKLTGQLRFKPVFRMSGTNLDFVTEVN